ncbi:MAG: hypothetical protein MJ224_00285 [archaeon]|nr:hypothetical protein [archaeon]
MTEHEIKKDKLYRVDGKLYSGIQIIQIIGINQKIVDEIYKEFSKEHLTNDRTKN